jgi:hypothetical protein
MVSVLLSIDEGGANQDDCTKVCEGKKQNSECLLQAHVQKSEVAEHINGIIYLLHGGNLKNHEETIQVM